ncbi:DUF4424 domain-containing protein [Devosia nitrariae]|uniref:DUF4424 domain-containing protein n=1 Tax=Devosia nitrariae TaxID=2071872 RepID=A0ABQ5W496_9HYPH|nr:DUF4424 domain-containing protein [Devosia nitrariae]GLQ54563.1 hypothetical protein GCM10010862_18220 [Devosia nitrariae]
MKLGAALVCLASVVPAVALANDTAAVLSTGGLQFVVDPDIAMVSEDLYISAEEIRVTYIFRNEGKADRNVLVAFPMPDITPDHWSPVAFPDGPDDNLFSFETTFDGEPVETILYQYAYAFGVDRTDYLRELEMPLVPFSQAAITAVEKLDAATIAEMLHLGLVVPDEFDAGEGWETHHWPMWTLRSTYTWEAMFPAGEEVTVEHRYKPSVGGTTGVSFLSEPYEGHDPAAEYAEKYCTDEAFLDAVRKTVKNGEPWSAPFFEQWISYILKTGANWNGPIGSFRLVIDKGEPGNLVSFCGEGVTKIGPTTFEMVKTDYWPDRDLDILILERHEGFE